MPAIDIKTELNAVSFFFPKKEASLILDKSCLVSSSLPALVFKFMRSLKTTAGCFILWFVRNIQTLHLKATNAFLEKNEGGKGANSR